jgi:SAM-dependent methyltransferase
VVTTPSWDGAYTEAEPPPWDIGRPQAAFTRLADQGLLSGQVLDVGCGTGEHTLLAAAHGAEATGLDGAPTAIARAREKAAERGLTVCFEVGDALDLGVLGATFGTVIDSGLFHVFSDEDRARYVASLAVAVAPGGTCYLMCFSDRESGDFGPRRVRQDELTDAFAAGWSIVSIVADTFEVRRGLPIAQAQAWLATIRRR